MKKRLAILTNMITPYRLSAYETLGDDFNTLVFHGGTERNRTWTVQMPPSLRDLKVLTFQIPVRKKTGIPGILDTNYVHLNLGLLWSLPRFNPDIIVSNEMGLRTIFAVLYGKATRIPVWVWWGGTLHTERNITRLRSWLRSILVRHVRRWISYGMTSTEYMLSIGIPRDQILQIQNCVYRETFLVLPSGPNAWFNGEPRPVILTVGQLIPRKGLDKLIEACGRLVARGRQFTLAVVGQGPERDRLAEMATRNGIQHFHIIPNQTQEALNEIYSAADVFVFPTLEDVWGLVVNEVMWTGTPILCSKYAGCAPELLPDSAIFDPMSRESFDAALEKVFDHSVPPPDLSRLKTWQQVSGMLSRAIQTDSPLAY
jgi:glycosyltransferase involved in cell wall biosynthesis